MNRRFLLGISLGVLAGLAPLSAAAQPTPAQPTLDVLKVADGVWGARPATGANVGWFVAGDGVVVVDAGDSPAIARAVLQKIAETAKKPVRTLILTHAHADHVGGARVFASAGAQVVCHESTATAVAGFLFGAPDAKDPADARAPAGSSLVTFSERLILVGLAHQFQAYWLGKAHTAGDVVVLLPKEKVLFSGDVAVNAPMPYMQSPDCDPFGWERVLVRLAGLSIDRLVPGHGEIGPKTGIQSTGSYVQKVNKIARELVETGVPEPYYVAKLNELDNQVNGLPVTDEHVANVKAVAKAVRDSLTRKPPEKKD